ncbi:Epoxyqueuosine reductase [uncultured Paludibacter sp.]|nr:Epoxyqueuosine reductase [uncultured Paludibacter sp.]
MKKVLTDFIKKQALEIGFDACGVAKAEFLEEDLLFFNSWLKNGFQAEMSYLERNLEKRFNPQIMVEECKSIVVVMLNYYPAEIQNIHQPKIAKYAYSKTDYHTVIKEKLRELENKIIENFGENCFNSKQQHLFVDSAPVLERRWGEKAGLGWIGRNKMLIHPDFGSHFFLGELFINEELEYDSPIKNRCGTCRKCLDACPTNALTEKNGLNARRCISYQTIENKKEVDIEIRSKLSGYAFGCDICNDVCPWNKSRNKPHQNNGLETAPETIHWTEKDWKSLSEEKFNQIFTNSAIKRAGFQKLKQNIKFVTEKN